MSTLTLITPGENRIVRKVDLSKYNLNEDLLWYRGCAIEKLPNDKYKVFGEEYVMAIDAFKAVNKRFRTYEYLMAQKQCN